METEPRPSFAALLRDFRRARRLSQEALAERSGLSREAVNLLERGRRRSPRRHTVSLLTRAMGLSSDERACLLAAATAPPPQRFATAARGGVSSGLPVRLTSFVGRDRELAEVQQLLRANRLVTLTGPGGIGKTSLALEVAIAVEPQFADGVGTYVLCRFVGRADPL
jgi:transcriptional regulator with XRE-family HTH domain